MGAFPIGARDNVRFRDYLYALSQHFAMRNVTAMFLLESQGPRQEGPEVPGREIAHISDNTLLLQMQLGAHLVRTIRVMKSRASAHDGREHAFRITAQGIFVE